MVLNILCFGSMGFTKEKRVLDSIKINGFYQLTKDEINEVIEKQNGFRKEENPPLDMNYFVDRFKTEKGLKVEEKDIRLVIRNVTEGVFDKDGELAEPYYGICCEVDVNIHYTLK